jgi:hypothetical protein
VEQPLAFAGITYVVLGVEQPDFTVFFSTSEADVLAEGAVCAGVVHALTFAGAPVVAGVVHPLDFTTLPAVGAT